MERADAAIREYARQLWPAGEPQWTPSGKDKGEYLAQVFQYHDVVALRYARKLAGQTSMDAFQRLSTLVPVFPANLPDRLGTAFILSASINSKDDAEAVASACLGAEATVQIAEFHLSSSERIWLAHDTVLRSRNAHLKLCVLALKSQADSGRSGLDLLLNETLPDLIRLFFKITDQHEQTTLLVTGGHLDEMADKLDTAKFGKVGSGTAEKEYESFSENLREYASFVSDFRKLTQTTEINIRNHAFHSAPLRTLNEGASLGWISMSEQAARMALAQQEADLAYHDARLRQAQTDMIGLQVKSDLEIARAERAGARAGNIRTMALAIVGTALAFSGLVDTSMAQAIVGLFCEGIPLPTDWSVIITRIVGIMLGGASALAVMFLVLHPFTLPED
jgi:hypothetical protein